MQVITALRVFRNEHNEHFNKPASGDGWRSCAVIMQSFNKATTTFCGHKMQNKKNNFPGFWPENNFLKHACERKMLKKKR